jgi:hypothetical protein
MVEEGNQGRVVSLNSIEFGEKILFKDFVADFNRKIIFILTHSDFVLVFNLQTNDIENVTELKGFKKRISYLDKSDWILTIDNRSQISILEYRQKLFHQVIKLDLGFVQIQKISEMTPSRLIFLDRQGKLSFYDIQRRKKQLVFVSVIKPVENQTITDFLYIPSVSV